MKFYLLLLLLLYCAPLSAQTNAQAAVAEQESEAEAEVHTLSPVVVRATSVESGATTISGADLEMLPSATGSITEA
ncbi:MAG: hypothetical protein R6V33_10440, partial [Pelovirga sp.]